MFIKSSIGTQPSLRWNPRYGQSPEKVSKTLKMSDMKYGRVLKASFHNEFKKNKHILRQDCGQIKI